MKLTPLGMMLLAVALAGCGRAARTGDEPPLHLLVNIDISASQTREEVRSLYGVLDQTLMESLPARTRVAIWSFARDARQLYDGQPTAPRDLWAVQDAILAKRHASGNTGAHEHGISGDAVPQRPPGGTLPSVVLEENLEELRRLEARGQGSAMLWLWDGEDARPAETRREVEQLAELKHLTAVWIVGVVAESDQNLWRQVRKTFAPVGERLIISGAYDRRAGLDRFQRLIAGGNHDRS
jgi:hypothetical protein